MKHTHSLLSLGAILIVLLSGCGNYWKPVPLYSVCPPPPFPPKSTSTYYVSPGGDDALGDGSSQRPWRHIQYGIDRIASYSGHGVPKLVLAAGVYEEMLEIKNSIIIAAETGAAPVTINADPAKRDANFTADLVVNIACNCQVTLQGLSINGRNFTRTGILVSGSNVSFDRIEVKGIYNFGIWMKDSPAFGITQSKVFTRDPADVGIRIFGSSGCISDLTAGNRFDHIIDILDDSTVTVRNSFLTGSDIYYADGIRSMASNAIMENNSIIRPAAQPPTGPIAGIPWAGIEISSFGRPVQDRYVIVRSNVIEGFDVGIGINLEGGSVLAERNQLSRNLSAAVDTYVAFLQPPSVNPILDFGGGALGSAGGNSFLGGKYAFLHRGPFDMTAYDNTWDVQDLSDIDRLRIWDKFDDPSVGKVKYCRRWTPVFNPFGPFSNCTGL